MRILFVAFLIIQFQAFLHSQDLNSTLGTNDPYNVIKLDGSSYTLTEQKIFDDNLSILTSQKGMISSHSFLRILRYTNTLQDTAISLGICEDFAQFIYSTPSTSRKFNILPNGQYIAQPEVNKEDYKQPELICETDDISKLDISYKDYKNLKSSGQEQATIDLYLEVDYALYSLLNSNLSETMVWISQVFSQVDLLYNIHNISVRIKEIKVWDAPDPYSDIYSNRTILPMFGETLKNEFSGQVALLLSGKNTGGRANLNKLCAEYDDEDHSGPYAIAASLNSTVAAGFIFNSNSNMIAHELGHVIGSLHTHACAWGPNNNQALDGCFTSEGSCANGTIPNDGGTLMSYCFFDESIGINFNNGFGVEPGALLYAKAISAPCKSCDNNQACNDGDDCTINDLLDEACNCVGTLIDENLNGICDNYEECLDMNHNDICDKEEDCPDHINLDTLNTLDQYLMAKSSIFGSQVLQSSESLILNAGNSVELLPGFEVPVNSSFQVLMSGCGEETSPIINSTKEDKN